MFGGARGDATVDRTMEAQEGDDVLEIGFDFSGDNHFFAETGEDVDGLFG